MRILKGLWGHFAEVRIIKDLVTSGGWRAARRNGMNLAASTRSVRALGAEYSECRLRDEDWGLQERKADGAEAVVGRNMRNGSKVLANCQLLFICTE